MKFSKEEKVRQRQLLGAYLDFFIHTIETFCPEKCAEINMQIAMDFCDDWITQEIRKVDKNYGQADT